MTTDMNNEKGRISVRNLNFYYGGQQALFNNTIEIEPKKVTAIIGPSGCGKSTHLMIFQKPTPFPMNVHDNVAYGLKLHYKLNKSETAGRIETALQQAALWDEVKDKLDKPGTALSGGQQQRLCIARALAVEPEIILMDEPTSAIDPVATSKIEDLIETLKGKYTIVIVTHNMQQAARISENTAFFFEGHIVEIGKTKDLFTRPKKKQTENYITGRFG